MKDQKPQNEDSSDKFADLDIESKFLESHDFDNIIDVNYPSKVLEQEDLSKREY